MRALGFETSVFRMWNLVLAVVGLTACTAAIVLAVVILCRVYRFDRRARQDEDG